MPKKHPTVVIQEVVVPEVKDEVKTDKKQTKSKSVKIITPVVPPTEVFISPIVIESLPEVKEGDSSVEDKSTIMVVMDKVNVLSNQIKSLSVTLKVLMKEYEKQKKINDKVLKKKEKAKKSPSGFAKPCKISDVLCDFIGLPYGTEKSRTEVTRFINNYVKEHNLNNPANRREFFPDKKLETILKMKDGEKATYFVLQRLISHHFPPCVSKQIVVPLPP